MLKYIYDLENEGYKRLQEIKKEMSKCPDAEKILFDTEKIRWLIAEIERLRGSRITETPGTLKG